MKYFALIVPLLFLLVFGYALIKKVKLYDCFTGGVKEAVPLVISLFPYLAAILMLSELFERSGLSGYLTQLLSPAFRALGIPPEISKLVLMKPFSGSGSTALLSEILNAYGADSYIGRCASVIYGSSETVFYISTIYFSQSRVRRLRYAIPVALVATYTGCIVGCFLLKFF